MSDAWERLYTPHRMVYLRGEGKPDNHDAGDQCPFCRAPSLPDDEGLVFARGSEVYGVLNLYPYNNGHLMIVPFRHTGSLADLSTEEHAEMLGLCSRAVEILREQLYAEGFNCGFNLGQAAGAGITDHVHLHVVPRWCGDANFMPIIGDTRSMPEYLEQTYDRLVGGFQKS